jgi:hypothetical protein
LHIPNCCRFAAGVIAHGGCDFLGSAASQMEVLNAQIGNSTVDILHPWV